jgi:glutathione peroxidase
MARINVLTVMAVVTSLAMLCGCGSKRVSVRENGAVSATNFHEFTVTDIHGNDFRMSDLRGKKVMVVNVASKCGLTPQYEGLEALYRKYSGSGLVIIGFPANNFMGQEPGTDEEILGFCTTTFDVTFPLMSKISVKGEDQHPVYAWLTSQSRNGVADSEVRWNFQKYLIDEKGKLAGVAWPREKPDSERIIKWLEEDIAPGGF